MTAKLQDDMNSIPLADDDPQGESVERTVSDFVIPLDIAIPLPPFSLSLSLSLSLSFSV